MKNLLIMLLVSLPAFNATTFHDPHNFIDPTGTYILKGDVWKNKIVGHSGEIRVKLLSPEKVAMCFYICKGYPGYEMGSFVDTLSYEDNRVLYTGPNSDGCTIVFDFNEDETSIQQWFSNPHSTCGFEKGVIVSKSFEKRSNAVPVIQDLSGRAVAAN